MKKFIYTIIALLGILMPNTAWAQTRAEGDGTTYREAYAVLEITTSEEYEITDAWITLYYDDLKSTRKGTVVDLDKMMESPEIMQTRQVLHSVIIDPSFADARPTSTYYWFGNCFGLKTISGLEYLNTSEVTNMACMFMDCPELGELDLSHFDTSKVTDMNNMFYHYTGTTLNLSSFDTSNVTDMTVMFGMCSNLTTIYVSDKFVVTKVTSGDGMFEGCTSLVGGNGTRFDENHTDPSYANIDSERQPGYFTYGESSGESKGEAEPYAVLDENKVVTFYYDDQKAARNGGSIRSSQAVNDDYYRSAVTAVFDASFAEYRPTNTICWFYDCSRLTTISGLENLKTDNVTDMSYMFNGCTSLTSLDLQTFNTENVTNMSYMFSECKDLKELNVKSFKTDKVTNMHSMFSSCWTLKTIDLSGFNTENVTDMGQMFYNCQGLTSLDVSMFITDNVTDMSEMFDVCTNLTSIDVSGFNTQKVTNMSLMFGNCNRLTNIDVKGFNTENVDNISGMFAGCSSLTNIEISGFNTANVVYMTNLFVGCSGLADIDVSGFNTEKVTDMNGMFSGCSGLTNIDVSSFNTEKVTNMNGMFSGCSGLKNIDLSNFRTDNVIKMGNMFSDCSSLTSLDLSGFNTEKLNDERIEAPYALAEMFVGCSSLEKLDISNFKTDNVKTLSSMFAQCSSLKELKLSSFNTENVSDMRYMFQNCTSLVSLDISSFNTANVTKMEATFGDCTSLTDLDLSSFDTSNLTDVERMFQKDSLLKKIYVSEKWNMEKVKWGTGMFSGCINLIGGAGTKYESGKNDQTYAHIDGGPENPGYLTDIADKGKDPTDIPTITFQDDKLVLTSKTEDAIIYYVIEKFNNELSTEEITAIAERLSVSTESEIYKEPITADFDLIIKSMAVKEGLDNSEVATYIYPYTEWQNLIETIKKCTAICDMIMYEEPSDNILKMIYDIEERMHSDMTVYEENRLEWDRETIIEEREKLEEYMSYIEHLWREEQEQKTTAKYENHILTVEGDVSMAQALEQVGGRNVVAKDIAAIVWNSSEAITRSDIEGFGNPNMLIYVQTDSLAPEGVNNVVIDGKAKSIILVDADSTNNNFYAPQAFVAESIQYTREFKQTTEKDVSRGWEGICLPFTVQKFTHESHGEIAPFGNDASIFHFWLHQMTDKGMANATTIEANKPYIISMPNNGSYPEAYNQAGKVTFSAENATVPASDNTAIWSADGTIGMMSTYLRIEPSEHFYALNVGNAMEGYAEGSVFVQNLRDVKPFEVYTFHEPSRNEGAGARFISVSSLFGGEGTTGIIDIMKAIEPNGETWYDMNGRRLQSKPSRKGVYIKNGKKVVVK